MKIALTYVLLGLSCCICGAKEALHINIIKSEKSIWTLSYTMTGSVQRLAFMRNPDNSRIARWLSISDEYQLDYIQGHEYIVKKDGGSFKEVTFTLTPTYKSLAKEYGPFSPFSDGAILFHSARFFACIESCDEADNTWNMSLTVPKNEHILVNGKIYNEHVAWLDKNDGQKVYVGKQQPVETEHFLSVIDSGLPEKMKASLNVDLAKLAKYFAKRLGQLQNWQKPTLFASYANVRGGSIQGGTLPKQVFMHWNVNDLHTRVEEQQFLNDTIWFFAHEVAHIYQSSHHLTMEHKLDQSWLHEGNADMLAALVLLKLYPESKSYVESRFKTAKNNCIAGLKKYPLIKAADDGSYGYYYSCGLLIHSAIDRAAKNKSHSKHNVYAVWNEYRNQVEQGAESGSSTFLSVVKIFTSHDLTASIVQLVNSRIENPQEFIDKFTVDMNPHEGL